MNEYSFSIGDYNFKFNDVIFDYAAYRNVLPENVCLEILNSVKKQSEKKVAIIFGNCQTEKLKNFLLNNKIFIEKYFVIQIPPVCNYLADKNIAYFQENFWSLCDLFISQRISNDNRFNPVLATQKIPLLLPEYAKIIWGPNVYFDGYFIQYSGHNLRNIDTDKHQSGRFPSNDKFVDAFLDGGGGRTPNFGTCRISKGAKFYFKGRSFGGRRKIF